MINTHHLHLYEHSPELMVDWYKKRKSDIVYVNKLRVFEMKDIFMNMLLHMNEDFDDDLLLDAINVLTA